MCGCLGLSEKELKRSRSRVGSILNKQLLGPRRSRVQGRYSENPKHRPGAVVVVEIVRRKLAGRRILCSYPGIGI